MSSDRAEQYFPDFDEFTRTVLWNLSESLRQFLLPVSKIEFIIAWIGFISNSIHLMVLTRKQMMTTSSYIILIGIGIHDWIVMICVIAPQIGRSEPGGCNFPPSYLRLVLELFSFSVMDFSRRGSLWLGVSLAAVRYIVLRQARKLKETKIGEPYSGWQIIIIISLLSSLFSILYHCRLKTVKYGNWYSPAECEVQENSSVPLYGYVQTKFFYADHELVLKIWFRLNGFLSKLIPCISLIVLTVLLIRELKIFQEKKKKIDKNEKQKTLKTKLVIYMTITYLIAELPMGIMLLFESHLTENFGFITLLSQFQILFNLINTFNATIHCLVCYSLSIQYQITFKQIFRVHKFKTIMVVPLNQTIH